jgi:hypothetical protein
MILDHVTYQVPEGALFHDDGVTPCEQYNKFFCDLLGMKEIKPDEGIEGKGWKVRWFEDVRRFKIHLVEEQPTASDEINIVDLGLGHFCAIISRGAYSRALESEWREDIGSLSGRAWMKGPGGIRVEIRPNPLGRGEHHADLPGSIPIPVLIAQARTHRIDDMDLSKLSAAGDLPTEDQLRIVFERCLAIFRERNRQHKDSWKREGWRGCLFNLRRKVERGWDHLWSLDPRDLDTDTLHRDVDDLLDSINYGALAVIATEEGNRDGQGGWWNA